MPAARVVRPGAPEVPHTARTVPALVGGGGGGDEGIGGQVGVCSVDDGKVGDAGAGGSDDLGEVGAAPDDGQAV